MSKSKCRCKSRAGVQKTRYTARLKAFRASLNRGWALDSGIYKCPTAKGVWHLTDRTKGDQR